MYDMMVVNSQVRSRRKGRLNSTATVVYILLSLNRIGERVLAYSHGIHAFCASHT